MQELLESNAKGEKEMKECEGIQHLHGTTFDFLSWQGGTLIRLGLKNREEIILNNKEIILKYAIGYCEGDKLQCRPKLNTYAVMFLKDNDFFWTHLTKKEFEIIFKGRH